MKVIFAQGNPETKYSDTRHNVGFALLDCFAKRYKATFQDKSKFFARIAELAIDGEKVLLVKPSSYYNETGQSARAIIDFYKLDPATDILVIHDDLALPFGTLRTRQRGGDAGNNGVKSLNAHIGPDYARLRVGVYNQRRDDTDDAAFVLSKFSKSEAETIQTQITPKTVEIIESFIAGALDITSHTT